MRNLNMTVTCWMMALVAGLLIAVSQPANAVPVTTFEENFNALAVSNVNLAHDVANAGDFIGVDGDGAFGAGTGNVNGWVEHGGLGHFHAVNDPSTNRNGVGGSNGLGNNYDGCPTGNFNTCGAAHATNVVATTTGTTRVIASVLTRLGHNNAGNPRSSGEAKLYLGDSTLATATGGPFNAYEVIIDSAVGNVGVDAMADGSFATLTGGAGASTAYPDPFPAGPFYEIKITVDQVGTAAEMAILEIDGTQIGTFAASGGAFDLTHIAVVSINDIGGGGQSVKVWDNFLVQTELVALVPEPATLSLLGMGAMGLMRRGRKA